MRALQVRVRGGQGSLVDGVSFEAHSGQLTAIVGRSGCGKSLTLRAVLGLLSSQTYSVSGAVAFDGRSVEAEQLAQGVPRGVDGAAMIFQDPGAHLNPLMTVGQHLAEVLTRHLGLRGPALRAETTGLLDQMRFSDPDRIAAAFPHQLSGGQKQRALIALALASRPKLLLADEPTSSLDATVQRDIMDLLDAQRRAAGLGLLIVTHDIAMALDVAARVYVMDQGRIVDRLEPGRLDPRQAKPETLRLLHAATREKVVATSPEAPGSIILQTHGLAKTYRNPPVVALEPLSLSVARGNVVAIVGESGSGKTTLGRLLVGLTEPTNGSISMTGRSADPGGRGAKAIQIVFQDPATALDNDRRIDQLLIETMRVNGIGASDSARRNLAATLLDKVALSPLVLGRKPGQLSGGERQRVAIARALSVEPEILICDESVSALDADVQGDVLALLSSLRRDLGLTILFITHDLALAERFADEVVVLHEGRLVEMGSVEAVLAAPTEPYTKRLVAAQYPKPPPL